MKQRVGIKYTDERREKEWELGTGAFFRTTNQNLTNLYICTYTHTNGSNPFWECGSFIQVSPRRCGER
jgi:hypothetical protein